MDEVALLGLDPSSDPSNQAQTLQYFEALKSSPDGWQLCAKCLMARTYQGNDLVKFFCYQVVENYLKTRYASCSQSEHQAVREFLLTVFQFQSQEDFKNTNYIRNKIAQLFSLALIVDYPHRWPTFFSDLLQMLNLGKLAIDLYLKILQQMDGEVVDREVVHTCEETNRNTLIKDAMRQKCVPELVNSWYQILTSYDTSEPELVCLCLEIIGMYVSWIDINLVANERFVSVFLHFLKQELLRESACDCIYEIVNKGMDPVAKTKLIESFTSVLDTAGIINPSEDEGDYLSKVSKLVNGMGLQLIGSWQKLSKGGDAVSANETMSAIEHKVALGLRFLGDEDDDVSNVVTQFIHDYITMLKQFSTLSDKQSSYIKDILCVIFAKMKYDESYNFDSEGEDEAMFQEYRKELKVIFNNLGQLAPDLLMLTVQSLFSNTLQSWKTVNFQDVEMALSMLYLLAEATPATNGQHFVKGTTKSTILQQMLQMMISSRVSDHPHSAVSLQYFETVVRYEKFFVQESGHIPEVLMSFLDKRGLHHASDQVRSRVAYLFSRFVKAVRQHLQPYIEEILVHLDDLLVLNSPDNGIHHLTLTSDEQMFIYETASILIVSSHFPPQKKNELMKQLLSPIATKFGSFLSRLSSEMDEQKQQAYAHCLQQAMAFASRTSKGFSNQQTMKSCDCIAVYTEMLQIFLGALNTNIYRQALQAGIRQFIHRMVVCMEDDILPFIPVAMEKLLKHADVRELHDFLPLMNQLIQKFKKRILPFLKDVFMPLVTIIFQALNSAADENDQVVRVEKQMLQRSYFLFLTNIVNNNMTEVLATLEPANLHEVMCTVVSGTTGDPDPVRQKNCFLILKKLIDAWGHKGSVMAGFGEFMYQRIVPACFEAPGHPKFDLTDGQTILALNESANVLKAISANRGEELTSYMRTIYLPSLDLPPETSDEYCDALNSDIKKFRNYLKEFFARAKS